MEKSIRTFIAVEIEERFRQELVRVQDKLRASGADVKWTEPQDIHLTLNFIGDIAPSKITSIREIMSGIAANIPAFPVDITELGAFPDILFPKIIWAGITRNADILARIANEFETGLDKFKTKKEDRKFAPHITLGRTRSSRGKDQLVAALEETNIPAGLTQMVNRLTLFQSQLTPQGPVYSVLGESALG